jgi:hypothetical protein
LYGSIQKNFAKNLSVVSFLIVIIVIGLLLILQGSITLIGDVGDLRVVSIEKKSSENLLGAFFLVFSLLTIIFSFLIQLLSSNLVKTKVLFFLQVTSLFLIILAGLSYFFFVQEVITEISITTIVDNVSISRSTLLGAFGFIMFFILLGLSTSITSMRRIRSEDTNSPSTN